MGHVTLRFGQKMNAFLTKRRRETVFHHDDRTLRNTLFDAAVPFEIRIVVSVNIEADRAVLGDIERRTCEDFRRSFLHENRSVRTAQ
ncbi:hypothetical protein Amme_051_009 [Acidomonas methanolica NBRC 104435]|uniref:Uncharacterized protein n=1 Tax=Acidomonas methanolica NBRC 104435 TaxID=1231351 RepID=A0A023D4X3_ACIMT|nr:hypothetical protein EDC31_1439 [Acidomonas methanolica]GAJ29193.1 hypothetical protein Amme_051_009 [Acidomonas methanolica NBRC 104435]GEL00563.1 hypothetical protein AME01nite_30610 [Acidomonas methanolica NBRC 104435]